MPDFEIWPQKVVDARNAMLDEWKDELKQDLLDVADVNPEGVGCDSCGYSGIELEAEIQALQKHIYKWHEVMTDGPCLCDVCHEHRKVMRRKGLGPR